MQAQTANPALVGAGLAKAVSLAGTSGEHITATFAINRLQQRFGYPLHVAALVADLAGLGPQAVR